MGKMNKILSEERKQDSALDAFLKDEAKHEEAVGDEFVNASPEVKKALTDIGLERRVEREEAIEEQVVRDAIALDTLADRGYLVNVHMTEYKSQVRDKKVADEVALAKNAKDGVVNVQKDLLPSCVALKGVNNLCASIRKAHGQLTLPWEDRGDRLVPSLDHMFKYWEWQKGAKVDFEKAKQKLDKEYDWALKKAHLELGDMYDPDDYLPKEEVLEKFTLTFNEKNVPTGDLRVVDNNEQFTEEMASMVETAQANAVMQHERRLARVSMKAWDTLIDPLCNMIWQLREEAHDGSEHGFSYRKQKDGSYEHGDPKKPQYKTTLTSNVLAQVDMLAAWFETAKGIDTDNDDAAEKVIKLANNFRNTDVEMLKEQHLLRQRTREYALKMLRAIPKSARDSNKAAALKQKQVGAAKQRVEILDSI